MKSLRNAFVFIAFSALAGCELGAPEEDLGELSQEVALPAPTNLIITNTTTTRMDLAWDMSAGATSYNLRRGTMPGSTTSYTSLPANPQTYSATGLTPGQQYCWQIENFNNLNERSQPSTEVCGTTLTTAAIAPTGVTATPVSTSRISVTWNAVAGATSYQIFQGQDPTAPTYRSSVGGASTSFLATGLASGTAYSFQVKAIRPGEESALSTPAAQATTVAGILAPTGVTATAISTTRITVTWNAVAGATSYQIFQGQDPTAPTYRSSVSAPTTTFTATGLSVGTAYSFQVKAVKPGEESALSTPAAQATTDGAVAAPGGVTATAISTSRITVTWNAVAGATGYQVFQGLDPAAPTYLTSVGAGTTSLTATGLATGTTYGYQVKAVKSGVESALSTPVATATTFAALAAPTGVTATAISSSRITVTWNAVADGQLSGYQVFQGLGGGATAYLATVGAGTTSLTSTGLAASTTYGYQVKALRSTGEESALSTPPATATTFAAGIEAFYHFDEQAGVVANDASGFGRTGALEGAVTYSTTGKPPLHDDRSYLQVAANTAAAITVPYNSAFNFSGTFSLALWVKIPAAADVRIAGMREASCGGAIGWELAQDGVNGLHLRTSLGVASFGTSLAVGTWTHVALTSDGTTLRMYLDGLEVSNEVHDFTNGLSRRLMIGHVEGCSGGAVHVDEVRILSRELSANELAAIGSRPPAPTNLMVNVVSSTRMDLSWTPYGGATAQIISQGTASGNQTHFTSAPAAMSSFPWGHCTPNTQYSWYVSTVRDGVISLPSNEVIATTLPGPLPPTGLMATPVNTTRIQLTWNAAANAQKYYVYKSQGGGGFTYVSTSIGTSFQVTGLTTMTSYSFKVVTVDTGNVESAQSDPVSATTL